MFRVIYSPIVTHTLILKARDVQNNLFSGIYMFSINKYKNISIDVSLASIWKVFCTPEKFSGRCWAQ